MTKCIRKSRYESTDKSYNFFFLSKISCWWIYWPLRVSNCVYVNFRYSNKTRKYLWLHALTFWDPHLWPTFVNIAQRSHITRLILAARNISWHVICVIGNAPTNFTDIVKVCSLFWSLLIKPKTLRFFCKTWDLNTD